MIFSHQNGTYVNYSRDTTPDETNYFLREPVTFVTDFRYWYQQLCELKHVWYNKKTTSNYDLEL